MYQYGNKILLLLLLLLYYPNISMFHPIVPSDSNNITEYILGPILFYNAVELQIMFQPVVLVRGFVSYYLVNNSIWRLAL